MSLCCLHVCLNISKEAQKCYCEAPNCRGWIGETPREEEKETIDIEKIEKREKDLTKKKKEETKPADYMEDEDVSAFTQLAILRLHNIKVIPCIFITKCNRFFFYLCVCVLSWRKK